MSGPQPRACSREFPGTVEGASEAENWVTRQASALGLGEEAEFAIGLCLEELFLNAVTMATPTGPASPLAPRR